MDSRAQEDASQDGQLAGEVMDSLGDHGEPVSDGMAHMQGDGNQGGTSEEVSTRKFQERIKRLNRSHEREIRDLQARMANMQQQPQQNSMQNQGNSYDQPQGGNIAEHIQQAVNFALQHKDNEERKVREAQNAAKVQRQYDDLHRHLDTVADKYEDFDDVVKGPDAQFSTHMRDAALFLPKKGQGSAGEVLYHLGKNPQELERISRLHPLEQASEMVKLSHALISGGEHKGSQSVRPLGQIKSNPVTNSAGVTEKTSPAEIRARMKAGKFK